MTSDIFKEAERHISRVLIEKYFAVPGAKWHKDEYWTLSPLRADGNIKNGTFSINESGLWHDLSTNESGNFIHLVSHKFHISKLEAAKKIIEDSGGIVQTDKRDSSQKKKDDKPDAIIPIPSTAAESLTQKVQSKFYAETWGKATEIYPYKNIDGETLFCTCRFEKESGKSVLPFYFTSNGWYNGRPKLKKFPLYHEQQLKENRLPVIIVEGERCANVKIEGYILVSWLGGSNAVQASGWDVLKDYKKIIIWPDNDESGLKASYEIKKLLPQAEILKIEHDLKGWDIYDAYTENIDLVKFISECPRIAERETPANPYDAFCQAILDCYGDGNLVQFDGLYYIYDPQKHYWEERLQINIESDIQKWIVDNHLEYLENTETAIHTFIGNTTSFLRRYNTGYYERNPFKDSALSPYIHLRNGSIHIKYNGFEFISRHEKPESFFRELYPTHCMNFDFDMKYYHNDNLQEVAPAFHHYMKSLVPENMEHEKQSTIDFFCQILAYCINPIKKRPHFFAMYGKQDTGKSFFPELLEHIIGEQFFVKRKMADMENRFAASDLWGSKIFVDDDVKANLKLPEAFIKFYSGEKSITIEKKNKDAIKGVKISVAMFFISNHSFSVSGGVEGIERRMIYIPFYKEIENPDVFLKEKIIGLLEKGEESGTHEGKTFDERPALIGMALRGIDMLISNNHHFKMPSWVSKERDKWLVESDSVTQFLHDKIYDNIQIITPKEMYDKYKEWCEEESKKPYGKNNFYEKVRMQKRIETGRSVTGDIFKIKTMVKDEQEIIPF